MYTGTLIGDLMATVERAEQTVELQRVAFEQELHTIYATQIPMRGERVYMGAA
jgi:hypothetical protein